MQVYGTPYRSCVDCARSIMAREGWRAFYYSFGTQLILNIPYQSLHFVVYEFVQDMVNPQRQYAPMSHVASGAAAGAVAAAVTTPFDVCKTLLNTQESGAVAQHGHEVQGIRSAAMTVYTLKGFKGFFSGTTARVLFQIPSTAIAWFVYEFFKYALKKQWHRTHQSDAVNSAEHHSGSRLHSPTSGDTHAHGAVAAGLGVVHVSAARNN
jgi:solute carrier family 25 (mitochondrial iron transporter), member 28/37